MKKILLFTLLFTAAPAFSATPCTVPGLPKITGLDYHTARALLIKAGFTPTLLTHSNDDPISANAMRDSLSFGYSEVRWCAPTGYAGCGYGWSSPKNKLFEIYARDVFIIQSVTCGHN